MTINPAKVAAFWDIVGLVLPLIGAWLLFVIAIPAIVPGMVMDGNWQPVLDGNSQPVLDGGNPAAIAAHNFYFWVAVPAMLLVTVGTLIQARSAIRVMLGR